MFSTSSSNKLNKFPLWKYLVILLILIVGILYALPNLYGEARAVQITGNAPGVTVNSALMSQVTQLLQSNNIPFTGSNETKNFLQFRFANANDQAQASEVIKDSLGENYTVALSLEPATPAWLSAIGAEPMKYGLDLRGGVHFLLDVDVNSVLKQQVSGDVKSIGEALRNERIRYAGIQQTGPNSIKVKFRVQDHMTSAYRLLHQQYPNLTLNMHDEDNNFYIDAVMSENSLNQSRQMIIEKTMTTLRNRVDQLGVSNAVVQQQGASRVSVDLPGVLDAGRAKQILGGTATLEFHIVYGNEGTAASYVNSQPPVGTRLYKFHNGHILVYKQIVLHGSSITSASASFGQDGQPNIDIRLGGGGESFFYKSTRDNVGKQMAIVYVEPKLETKVIDGKKVTVQRKIERVISAPVIQSALGNSFQITGIQDPREAQNLALLLRAGSLPATISIAQERTVGPTLGKENIDKGLLSIAIGFLIVVVFMAIYYHVLGIFADIALLVNLILLVAVLSLLGMVLTLPGIAGIVLTVGMAVDANVLIFERIREEMRNGLTPQACIQAGFGRAFSTIVDSNVTTLIAALALFGIGTGPIKGFAVTLSFGILTSMFTAITGTRAMVNLTYGGKQVKKISVGI